MKAPPKNTSTLESLDYWAAEIDRTVSVFENMVGGGPEAMEIADGNRAIASTMRDAAALLRDLLAAAKACAFEGLTKNHDLPRLIPSDMLRVQLQRLRDLALATESAGGAS